MESSNYLLDLASSQPQSAVEKFAVQKQINQLRGVDSNENAYHSLIPAGIPGNGEQYAFEVDLDRCSACKACVSACHHMNGLNSDESWRRVQQWFGDHETESWFQTVTSACHHCVNAECMNGCPVGAYDKNPLTGIVKHLDDQCIGCEYCIWKCPYEVPKYHESHGVVRKCDMCSERLENKIEPACVQACPHDAIEIGIVNKDALINDLTHPRAQNKGLYPGAPPSSITQPTSQYKTSHTRMDVSWTFLHMDVPASKPHWPLIFMLILTQWGIGVLSGLWFVKMLDSTRSGFNFSYLLGVACLFAGLGSSIFHLGKPQKAWRFFLGLRTSWLSREIFAFNILAVLVLLDVSNLWLKWMPRHLETYWRCCLIFSGFGSVLISVMIYHDTHRPQWSFAKTAPMFFGTLLLGVAYALIFSHLEFSPAVSIWGLIASSFVVLAVSGAKVFKLRVEKIKIVLRNASCWFLALAASGIIGISVSLELFKLPVISCAMAMIAMLLTLGGEFIERFNFFTKSTPPLAPGTHNIVKP